MFDRFFKDGPPWMEKLESSVGWTSAYGTPKDLYDWVLKHNEREGTAYRVGELNGVCEYAWNPNRFDPRAAQEGEKSKYHFLGEYSEGVQQRRLVNSVMSQFKLPAIYLAETIVNYWVQEGLLERKSEDVLVPSAWFLAEVVSKPDILLENKKGLVTIEELMNRLHLQDNEIADIFPDAPPKRLVSEGVILDLDLRRIDGEWISQLILQTNANLIPLARVAEQLGVNELGINEPAGLAITKRLCSALSELYPEYIIEERGGYLSIGKPNEVIEAHMRRAEEAISVHQKAQQRFTRDLEEVQAQIATEWVALSNLQGPDEDDSDSLGPRAIRAAFLQRYAQRLVSHR